MHFIQNYKDREINFDKPVDVYRCLQKKGRVYSIRQQGKVVGHTEVLNLKDVKFVINAYGKKQAIRTKQRNVHAFVRGYISDSESGHILYPLSYCPFSKDGFIIQGEQVESSPFVAIRTFGIYAATNSQSK